MRLFIYMPAMVFGIFALLFLKQRDYWRKPDGSAPQRDTAALEGNKLHLAE